MWADAARAWRIRNAIRLFERVQAFAREHGFTFRPIRPRLLFPILESASLEDDQDLSQRWAALLANAARTDYAGDILPGFPDILRQLTAGEAQFLDSAYDEITNRSEERRAEVLEANPNFRGDVAFMGISGKLLGVLDPVLIDNLERLRLVTRNQIPLSLDNKIINVMPPANHLYISPLGTSFIQACRLGIEG
jgi:hypothetical protein